MNKLLFFFLAVFCLSIASVMAETTGIKYLYVPVSSAQMIHTSAGGDTGMYKGCYGCKSNNNLPTYSVPNSTQPVFSYLEQSFNVNSTEGIETDFPSNIDPKLARSLEVMEEATAEDDILSSQAQNIALEEKENNNGTIFVAIGILSVVFGVFMLSSPDERWDDDD